MKVNYYATLRQIVGGRQVEFDDFEGQTLRQLLQQMVERFPDLRAEILDDDGNLYNHIHIFINGRDSTLLDNKLDTVLAPADVISIFPPVGGGRS
jgi:sulfur-carrier protein